MAVLDQEVGLKRSTWALIAYLAERDNRIYFDAESEAQSRKETADWHRDMRRLYGIREHRIHFVLNAEGAGLGDPRRWSY